MRTSSKIKKGGAFIFIRALYRYPTIIATRADQVNRGTFKNTFESFITFGLTFLREFKVRLKFNCFVGKLNVLCYDFRGSRRLQKTFTLMPSVLFLIFIHCRVGSDFMRTGS